MQLRVKIFMDPSKRLYISSNFFTFGSHIILVFCLPNGMLIFQRGPLKGESNAREYDKITSFDQYLASSRKLYMIEPKVTVEGE